FALRDVLLEAVVLDRAPEPVKWDAPLLGVGEVHRPDDRRGPVDRHRGRDLIQGDTVEEDLHVVQRVDGDALPADLAAREWIVRGVERIDRIVRERREARLSLGAPLHRGAVYLVEPALLRGLGLLNRHAASSERAITRRWISLVPS